MFAESTSLVSLESSSLFNGTSAMATFHGVILCKVGLWAVSAIIEDMRPLAHRGLMTVEFVCRIDQSMHGKVEIAAAAVPE